MIGTGLIATDWHLSAQTFLQKKKERNDDDDDDDKPVK